jgi:type I restriction enzyme S subunit
MNSLAKISDFAEVFAGGGAPQNADDFSEDGIPFLRAGSLPKLLYGAKESNLEKITNEVAKKHRLQLHQKGSIVFAKSGMSATKGHIYRLKNDCYVVNHLAVIKPNAICDSKYLEHALKQYSPTSLILDAAYPSIRLSDISDFKIPLPPLAEQQRIAAILDKAEEIKRKRIEAIAKLDELAQSTFVEMFGDLVSNPKKWTSVTVGDFVKGFESGKSFLSDSDNEAAAEYRILKISAVTSLEYDPQQSKPVPAGYTPPTSHLVRKGDLLFSRANTAELIGATAYVNSTPPNILLPDKLWRFVWHDVPKAEPLYVRHLFRQNEFRYLISKLATGSSGSMKNISQGKVLSIPVGLPPIDLQIRFTNIIKKIELEKASYVKSQIKNTLLISSLQHEAFTTGFRA